MMLYLAPRNVPKFYAACRFTLCLWKKCNITNTKCLEKWFRLKSYNKTQNFKADLTKTSQNQDPEKESTMWIWNTETLL